MMFKQQIDLCIEAAINRLSCDGGFEYEFHIDLHSFQQRITEQLVDRCTDACQERRLEVVGRVGNALSVIVNLRSCVMTTEQAAHFSEALAYSRTS